MSPTGAGGATGDPAQERLRRWRLVLGRDSDGGEVPLTPTERRMDEALGALYDGAGGGKRQGGLQGSSPRVARWLGDIRTFFPSQTVQLMQRDALERLGLKQMLLEPELLSVLEADVHLVAQLIALRSVIPAKTRETARAVVEKVVRGLLEKLESRTVQAVRGALDRSRRSSRPRPAEIDWPRTIGANLRHYEPELGTIIPERLIGHGRRARAADLETVILCVDQSGSMASSVVYSSIFAAVLASIPALRTRLVAFDTVVLDLTEELADPVEVLFGVQLGGGTDIGQALSYCGSLIDRPGQTHLVLVSDLFEGGDADSMLATAAALIGSGVNVIVLLALSDDGRPVSCEPNARRLAALGAPVFGCTPDLFPDMMAVALRRQDIHAWATAQNIQAVRSD